MNLRAVRMLLAACSLPLWSVAVVLWTTGPEVWRGPTWKYVVAVGSHGSSSHPLWLWGAAFTVLAGAVLGCLLLNNERTRWPIGAALFVAAMLIAAFGTEVGWQGFVATPHLVLASGAGQSFKPSKLIATSFDSFALIYVFAAILLLGGPNRRTLE